MIDQIMDIVSGGGDKRALGIQEGIARDISAIPLPILKEYYPELYKIVAQMNPEVETAVNLGPSEMAGISTDPKLRQAQLNALAKLESIGLGEQSAEDQARQAQIISDVNTNLQGQTGAIMQNLAQRGLSGGGTELVQRNMAAQQAANRQAQMAMDAKAQAERRALDAIMQSGQLGGQMQAQDFSQAAQKAQAADAIARFNAANQQDVMSRNVGAKNQAQQYNVGQAQNVAAGNVDLRNAAQQQNADIAQRQFENELRKKGLLGQAQQNVAQSHKDEAAARRQFIGGLISAGSKAATGGVG